MVKESSCTWCLLHTGFILDLFFGLEGEGEGEGDMLLDFARLRGRTLHSHRCKNLRSNITSSQLFKKFWNFRESENSLSQPTDFVLKLVMS
jgi:hypothetical protein